MPSLNQRKGYSMYRIICLEFFCTYSYVCSPIDSSADEIWSIHRQFYEWWKGIMWERAHTHKVKRTETSPLVSLHFQLPYMEASAHSQYPLESSFIAMQGAPFARCGVGRFIVLRPYSPRVKSRIPSQTPTWEFLRKSRSHIRF